MQHPCAPGKNATSAHGHPLSLELYRTKERMGNDYLVLLGHHWRTYYYIHAVWQDGSWKSVHLSSFLFKCIFFQNLIRLTSCVHILCWLWSIWTQLPFTSKHTRGWLPLPWDICYEHEVSLDPGVSTRANNRGISSFFNELTFECI